MKEPILFTGLMHGEAWMQALWKLLLLLGIIINKRNAYPDRSCLNNGNSAWNGIIVEHADGSEAWYWHFKTGSATTKNIGDAVVAGEYLGLAGSSGSSDWPHVHFQVNDSSGNFIDPWEGPCNPTTPVSLWQNQQPQCTFCEPCMCRVITNRFLRLS
ncbi:MAG: M23 family metallopeptidase [Bacteroidetes bacterium]|nr:M23 family metallopeptidase [Bacteroidota bacterium]